MRLRLAMLGLLLAAIAVAASPGAVSAAPHHNRGLTINATPNPIIAGEGVLIYGQLQGSNVAGQTISLYHRVNPSHGFTLIGKTTTNAFGFYEFTREEGLVYTNRSWFVRGPADTHSRTVHERVAGLVSLHASRTSADTRQPILFYGHVTPTHAFERVFLQVQRGSSDDWRTIDSGRLGPGSNYAIVHRFRIPGERTVRVLLRADSRNVRSASDPLNVTIEQAQVADFTIKSSDPVIQYGQPVKLSGTLYKPGTKASEPNTAVTLCHRAAPQPQLTCDTAGMTGADGGYSFTVSPLHNTVYVVRTALAPHRHTATLFEGVQDIVTLTASSSTATASQPVTFTGTVTPNKAGDVVYLQRLGADGDYHTVSVGTVRPDSTFQFVRVFGNAGTKTFRARVPGDPENVGGASAPVTVAVTLPPVSVLPPAH